MERQLPNPLKLLRHQQAAKTKLQATPNMQREGALHEKIKLHEAEANEKAVNTECLKKPPTTDHNGDVDPTKQHQTT
jgi:hypothetical protein